MMSIRRFKSLTQAQRFLGFMQWSTTYSIWVGIWCLLNINEISGKLRLQSGAARLRLQSGAARLREIGCRKSLI